MKRTPTTPGTPGALSNRVRNWTLAGLFGFVVGFLVVALAHYFPPTPFGVAQDWRVFYGAGKVVQAGGSPYNLFSLQAAEQGAQAYPNIRPGLDSFVDLPIVAEGLRLLALVPFWVSYGVGAGISFLVAAFSLRSWLGELGWERVGLWVGAAMASWVMVLGLVLGQFDAIMLGGLVGSLICLRKDRPVLAGICMAVVMLKPHLLWPLPLLLLAVWTPDWRRAWRFGLSAGVVLISLGVSGFWLVPGSGAFFGQVWNFSQGVGSSQPDLAGMPGLLQNLPGGTWVGWAVTIGGGVGVLGLAGWVGLGRLGLKLNAPDRAFIPLVGLALWMACAPYAHSNDAILVIPLLAALVGIEGRNLIGPWLGWGVVACLVLIAAYLAAYWLGDGLLLASLVIGFWQRSRLPSALPALALASLVLLPAVGPFHLLAFSLTPIAVGLVAGGGAWWAWQRLGDSRPKPNQLFGETAGA